jgi:hypothetical protein
MKIVAFVTFVAIVCFVLVLSDVPATNAQTKVTNRAVSVSPELTPDQESIDRFDAAVQRRFLTQPSFGMGRMMPTKPQPLRSGHVPSFGHVSDEERSLIAKFKEDGWLVGLYLYGRRAEPDQERDNPMEKFKIRYRVTQPVSVTYGLKENKLPGSKGLVKEIRQAFGQFQGEDSSVGGELRFRKSDWTFVARPVMAVNESCVKCHADYVVTNQLEDGRFQFRKRKIGDVNGVVVYAFSRDERKD